MDDIVKKYNIKILPLKVVYSHEEEYRDRVEITPEDIYERFDKAIPTTSLPSSEDTFNLFRKLEEEGYTHVIVTTIPTDLSGTMNIIRNVSKDFKNMVFELIDSKALNMGLGFPVLQGVVGLEWQDQRKK
ncbi:EDD domain protein, DegV family [Paramaledivibacter caminithermalis DSM 15212]|jgi:DegV family protein with EDD domain|uniref:EDD domain protein, DegV family n=2 Tax=Paramaledivibacter TaxID=1884934 RepID=A0A1M6SFS8_PARC5|nr:EDD domain protein, DegV family [Paramaledivibacter caminithermalis DSM 15212]